MNKINFLFVTLFGIGKLKKIPGSYASLATTIFLFIFPKQHFLTHNRNKTYSFLTDFIDVNLEVKIPSYQGNPEMGYRSLKTYENFYISDEISNDINYRFIQNFNFFFEDHLKDALLYSKYKIRNLFSMKKKNSFDYFQKSLNEFDLSEFEHPFSFL